MPVTIKKIAEKSGMSIPTVSQILNKKGDYRPETRDRVLKVALDLGYRPNGFAQAMRSGRFHCVALLLSTEKGRSSLPEGLLRGIHNEVAANDLNLMTAMLPDQKLTDAGVVPRLLRQLTADGLLINYTDHIPARMMELIGRHGIPSVWVNTKQPHDCVRPDDFAAGRTATEHLLRLGHRRIAYADFTHIAGGSDELHYSASDRQAGYEQTMRNAGLMPTVLLRTEKNPTDQSRRVAQAALEGPDRITAVITYALRTANTIALVAEGMGLRVPDDLSVVTFNNGPTLLGYRPACTMLVPDEAVGRSAVAMLQRKIENPILTQPCVTMPFGIEPGATVAPK